MNFFTDVLVDNADLRHEIQPQGIAIKVLSLNALYVFWMTSGIHCIDLSKTLDILMCKLSDVGLSEHDVGWFNDHVFIVQLHR